MIQYDHKGSGHKASQAFHWSQWPPREKSIEHAGGAIFFACCVLFLLRETSRDSTSVEVHAALLSVGHTAPSVMTIHSPHGSCIRRKRQLLGGATAPKPAW